MAYQFECGYEGCDFLVRSDTDAEVASLARAHARVAHGSRFAPVDVERGIERVDAG